MKNSIEKLTVLRMMELDFEELLGHADEVSSYNEEVQRGLRRKAYAEGYEQGKYGGGMDELHYGTMDKPKETAQDKRDRIVEQAKADITDLRSVDYWSDSLLPFVVGSNEILCDVYFVVNKDKRTVVALMERLSTGKVYKRGFAKCDPNDCFNVHIGKAIALRRALEVEVPDEYINTPQPTEVRVGDVVKSGWSRKEYLATREPMLSGNCVTREDAALNNFEIIDDSREDE